ncbi:MAG: N-acetyltransferase [Pseudomonadales bacterium]
MAHNDSALSRQAAQMSCAVIRPEAASDADAVRSVTYEAFESMPFAAGDEHLLIDALRSAHALAVSLVAEVDGRIIGHIAISPATPADDCAGWYALGPVSVLPACQRRGVGSDLVRRGLEEIAGLGAIGCILTGDPAYYARFGFEVAPALAPSEEPAEHFMVRLMGARNPRGPIRFHEAFHGGP